MYSVEKTKGHNYAKQFDYLLFVCVVILSGIGLLVLSSATRVMPNGVDGNKIMIMQAMSLLVGMIIAIVLALVDYKDYKAIGFILYIISIFLLILVLFIAPEQQGSRSWFRVPIIGSFQPSELAKITLIIFVCVFLEKTKEEPHNSKQNILKFAMFSFFPIILVLLQPDAGTALVFIFMLFVILFVYGIPYRWMGYTFMAAIPFAAILWVFKLKDYQKSRILSFLSPDQYAQGSAYNVNRSEIAIGSGKIFGKGLYQGIQTQNMGVPVKESDFIFSVVGEELGFIGVAIIILLIVIILMRCLYIAKNSRDVYGTYLVAGMTGMLTFHFVENIGMSIRILPVTGIPLPFVSQGGSAMLINYIAIGIILSVSMRRKRTIFNAQQ